VRDSDIVSLNSKFQQQITGQWNQRVLESPVSEDAILPEIEPPSFSYESNSNITDSLFDKQLAKSKFQQQMTGQWNNKVLRSEKYGKYDDKFPEDLPRELDLSSTVPFRIFTDENQSRSDYAFDVTLDVLKEFDRDYIMLRNRLLKLIYNNSSNVSLVTDAASNFPIYIGDSGLDS
jgi:hypothetical protein